MPPFRPFLLGCLVVLLAFACQDDPTGTIPEPDPQIDDQTVLDGYLLLDLDQLPNYADPAYPVHYDAMIQATDNSPADNRITDMGATLGRVLFYDQALSLTQTVSCASCHQQANGFTDGAVRSTGHTGGLTGQHSMRLANANFYVGEEMFWDRRAADLEDQATQPVHDAVEMGFNETVGFDSLLRRMASLPYYPILFERAFGSEEITEDRMRRALAQFVRSIQSVDSRFDAGYAQVFNRNAPGGNVQADFPNFTASENQGKTLFLNPLDRGGVGCGACHQPPTFALAPNSRSNGLDTGESVVFKSPSLKNVAVGGPYMHDGRFATLEEVVDHYDQNVQPGPALDPRLRLPNGPAARLNLNSADRQALIDFLRTLDDPVVTAAVRFGDPFRQ